MHFCYGINQIQSNHKHDIGICLGKSVDNTLKYEMLMSPWNPCSAYDFKAGIGVFKIHFWLNIMFGFATQPF